MPKINGTGGDARPPVPLAYVLTQAGTLASDVDLMTSAPARL
jgi:hypothetical protein